jgi:RNA polymerase sigma-70 factor (ECF subfamily)
MAAPVDFVPSCWRARKARDRAAGRFEALYLTHEAEMFRYLARRVGVSSAEAVLAEVFAVAWQRFVDRDRAVPVRDWLLGIAIEQLQRCEEVERGHLLRFAATGVDPLAGPTRRDRPHDGFAPVVARALAELTSTDRDVLTLHLWTGISHEGIAEVLGIEPRGVAARIERAGRFVRGRVDRARADAGRDRD